jgi:hypothetical protein
MPIKPLGGFGLTTDGGGGGLYTTVIDQDLNGVMEIYIDTQANPNCRWRLDVDQAANGTFQVQAVTSLDGINVLINSTDITRFAINPDAVEVEETENAVSFAAFRNITGRALFRGHGFIAGRGGALAGSWMQGECMVGSLTSTILTGARFSVRNTRQFIGFRFTSAVDVGRLVVEELL